MDRGRTSFNHRLHELKRIQVTAESGFSIGDDWSKPVHSVLAFSVMHLVSAQESVVNLFHHVGNAVAGIEALVGIHLPRKIGVARHLPAAQINGFQSGQHLLHGLVAGHCAQCFYIRFRVEHVPEAQRSQTSERMFNLNGPAQPHHVFGRIRPFNARPAGILYPFFL